MKNILFVSIAFPPKNDPECLQTAKYFKYMADVPEWNIDVVTSKHPTLFMPVDPKLEKYAKGERQKVEIPIYENKYLNYLIRKVNANFLLQPDSKYTFKWGYKKVIKTLREKPDVIYSRSFPMSSTYLAARLVEHYQVPWILHLSDPWIGSPIHKLPPHLMTKLGEQETQFFSKATYICLTSKKTQEFYQERYPQFKDKFLVFPNVFDPSDITTTPYEFKDKLRFVYTGGLAAERSPKYLFEAIQKIQEKDAPLLKNVEFVFAGQFDRQNAGLFDAYQLDCVKNKGLLSYPDALKLQQSADVLMVIDTPLKSPKDAMFFPSKLLDYFIAKRRILALTDKGSTSFEVVDGKYGRCFEHQDIDGIAQAIEATIQAWNHQKKDHFFSKEVDETFSAMFNVQRLVALINNV